MAKTEVILTHNIVGLGGESDQVKVAAGYARNYLFPQGLAIPLTAANKRRIEALRQRRAEREAHELNTMTELSKSLSKLICLITVKTGEDGKMFGTVTSGMIADQLKTQFDVTLDKKKIHLEHPIRALGDHEIELRLHQDVATTLKVRVESTHPAARAASPPPLPRPRRKSRRPRSAAAVPNRPTARPNPARRKPARQGPSVVRGRRKLQAREGPQSRESARRGKSPAPPKAE